MQTNKNVKTQSTENDKRHPLAIWLDRYLGCRFVVTHPFDRFTIVDCELLGMVELFISKLNQIPDLSLDFQVDFKWPLKREKALFRFVIRASFYSFFSLSSLCIQICKSGNNPDFLDLVLLKKVI